ncbi:S-adenosyl-L-methionine-dependent methyltransferase [Pavlovales sp. CCMP2436]|nr:S-adenosyl-L-methionine-dependent methyltransferase [Pavlovales sp. CCMP2436]
MPELPPPPLMQPPLVESPRRPRGRSSNKHAHHAAYTTDASRYDRLSRAQGSESLLAALRAIFAARHACSPFGAATPDIVDIGTGSGKLLLLLCAWVGGGGVLHCLFICPCIVSLNAMRHCPDCPPPPPAPFARSAVGVDRENDILNVARQNLERAGSQNCSFAQADARTLPLPDASRDVALAGWALCYLKAEYEFSDSSGRSWGPWRDELDRALDEIDRVLRPGGVAVILESLGTATETPRRLRSQYYAHLRLRGFEETWVRTDYKFASQAEAEALCLFFYGGAVSARVSECQGCESGLVPECTGVWWRRRPLQHSSYAADGACPPGSAYGAVAQLLLDGLIGSWTPDLAASDVDQ